MYMYLRIVLVAKRTTLILLPHDALFSLLDLWSLSLSLSLSRSPPPLPSLSQPFPHHEFTPEGTQKSLHALGLFLSASLVVSKQSVGGATVPMETSHTQSRGPTRSSVVGGTKKVSFGREQIIAASSHIQGTTPQGTLYSCTSTVYTCTVHVKNVKKLHYLRLFSVHVHV